MKFLPAARGGLHRWWLGGLFFAALAASLRAGVLPEPDYREVAPGVAFGRVKSREPLLAYYVLKVDSTSPGIRVRPIRNQGAETLEMMSRRLLAAGEPLLGAISGDYFDDLEEYRVSVPFGIFVQENELVFSPSGKSALVLDAGSSPSISVPEFGGRVSSGGGSYSAEILAVNRPGDPDRVGCYLYTPAWGDLAPEIPRGKAFTVKSEEVLRAGREIRGKLVGFNEMPVRTLIPEDGFVLIFPDPPPAGDSGMELGETVRIDCTLAPPAYEAIGGGPRLVRAGRVSIEFAEENFSPGHAFYLRRTRHPRSAVGLGPDGKTVFLVMVEGRSEESRGMNIADLAALMLQLGTTEAISFDGGRSVGMFVGGEILGHGHRKVANALGIFSRSRSGEDK